MLGAKFVRSRNWQLLPDSKAKQLLIFFSIPIAPAYETLLNDRRIGIVNWRIAYAD